MMPLPSLVAAVCALGCLVGAPSTSRSRAASFAYSGLSGGGQPSLRDSTARRKNGASTVRTTNPYRDAS